MQKVLAALQKLGKSLMLPIATLPIAGLLLRFGQSDLLNIPFIANSGNALFTNLPILFAIGIAVGLAKDNHGASGLAGAVCYFVLTASSQAVNKALQVHTMFTPQGGMPKDLKEIDLACGDLDPRHPDLQCRFPDQPPVPGDQRYQRQIRPDDQDLKTGAVIPPGPAAAGIGECTAGVKRTGMRRPL